MYCPICRLRGFSFVLILILVVDVGQGGGRQSWKCSTPDKQANRKSRDNGLWSPRRIWTSSYCKWVWACQNQGLIDWIKDQNRNLYLLRGGLPLVVRQALGKMSPRWFHVAWLKLYEHGGITGVAGAATRPIKSIKRDLKYLLLPLLRHRLDVEPFILAEEKVGNDWIQKLCPNLWCSHTLLVESQIYNPDCKEVSGAIPVLFERCLNMVDVFICIIILYDISNHMWSINASHFSSSPPPRAVIVSMNSTLMVVATGHPKSSIPALKVSCVSRVWTC